MGGWPSKATPATANSSGWSALPPELLDLILRRLSSLADRLRFAYVCHHWRHAVTHYSLPGGLPWALPWLNFRNGRFQSLPDGELHSFRFRKDAMCYGCCNNWLLFEESGCRPRRRHYLNNPILRVTKRLPGRCKEPVQLKPDGSGSHGASSSRSSSTGFHIRKVIMCSRRDLVVASIIYKRRLEAVVCCRPGVSSSWSVGLCNDHGYKDMAFYKEKFYTITVEGDLFAHEITDTEIPEPRVSQIQQVIQSSPELVRTFDGSYATLNCARRCYLVISCTGKLLMVRWIVPDDPTKDMTIKVFEADFVMSRWLEVESLGDQVLFISSYCSRAVRASGHDDYLQGNQIYFLNDCLQLWFIGLNKNNRPTCGVYDMSSNTIQPISLGERHISTQSVASWFFP